MPDYDFSQVDCLLYDPVLNVRRLLCDALAAVRLNRVQAVGRADELRQALQSGAPDLLIADAGEAEAEVLRVIHEIRHAQLGANPFMGIVVTAFSPTPSLLARVTNSGADSLLVKPVAPRHIQERILALIESARNFVVTSDFIGPDRRKSEREGQSSPLASPLVEVPNTLRIKARGMGARIDLRDAVERATAEIMARKLARQAFQIAFLLEFARAGLETGVPGRLLAEHVARIPALAEELGRRLPAADPSAPLPAAERLSALCAEAARIGPAILAGGPPAGIEPALGLALDLMGMVAPDRPRAALLREVQEAAAAYRARLAAMVQAKLSESGSRRGPAI